MNGTQFSNEANEMHAGAADHISQAERDEMNAFCDEVAGSVPDPQPQAFGSLSARESQWAHDVLTGGIQI